MNNILYSKDEAEISTWAKEALENELYMEERVLKYVFAGEAKIYCMAYLKGMGCSLYHEMPARFFQSETKKYYGSVYVKPEYRHKGIGKSLSYSMEDYMKENFPNGFDGNGRYY